MEHEVVVVGAGPAGVATAIHLHRLGHDVVVVDRATFPRDKVCGDGLTVAALRELEHLGLEPTSVPSWRPVRDVVVRSPSGRQAAFPLPDVGAFAVIATRRDLDAALVATARTEGVTVLEDAPVVAASTTADHIEVRTPDAAISARMAVGADGMWSPLRKLLGVSPPGYRGEWHAFRQYHDGVTGPAASEIHVSFEADLVPGYFWTFPLPDGRANVGFGILRGGRVAVGEMRTIWSQLLSRPHLSQLLGAGARPAEPVRAWPIPARPDAMPAGVGRALFVGDAVAASDVLTGEGIGQALLTGRLAAEAIHQGGDDSALVQRAYRDALATHLLADHRMSVLLHRALSHRKGARAAVWIASRSEWTRRNFARWLFEDYPRGIALTPSRWRRGIMSGPGAYRHEVGSSPGRHSERLAG